MKKATMILIEKKFQEDVYEINRKIGFNKAKINTLGKENAELKRTRAGLTEILNSFKKK